MIDISIPQEPEWDPENEKISASLCRAYDARVEEVRALLEQNLPMRRKQTSLWLCRHIEYDRIKTIEELKALFTIAEPFGITKAQRMDIAVLMGGSENDPERERLQKYIEHLRAEIEKTEKRLLDLPD